MPPTSFIRMVIADDSSIFRKGLAHSIGMAAQGKILVVGEAENGKQLIEEVDRKRPDIVMTDIRMPLLSGIDASRIIHQRFRIPVIALTMFSEPDMIYEMFEAGAKGYLTKTSNIEEVTEAIEAVHAGEVHYCSSSSFSLVKKIGAGKYNQYKKNNSISFNDKEIELMKLICIQLTTKEIAARMNLSHRTVEEYSRNIKDKIEAKNTVGIALYALKNHLVNENEI